MGWIVIPAKVERILERLLGIAYSVVSIVRTRFGVLETSKITL